MVILRLSFYFLKEYLKSFLVPLFILGVLYSVLVIFPSKVRSFLWQLFHWYQPWRFLIKAKDFHGYPMVKFILPKRRSKKLISTTLHFRCTLFSVSHFPFKSQINFCDNFLSDISPNSFWSKASDFHGNPMVKFIFP